jgi:hypothetical protein
LPQEPRVAGITSPEEANRFLQEQYIAVFDAKFTVPATERGTAFRRCGRADLDWFFTVQTERVVAKDNAVAIAARSWQLDKSRFRHSLAGCTVTIHSHHLDPLRAACSGSIRSKRGTPWKSAKPAKTAAFPLSHREYGDGPLSQTQKAGGSRRLKPKPDRSLINKTGHLDLLTTGDRIPFVSPGLRRGPLSGPDDAKNPRIPFSFRR